MGLKIDPGVLGPGDTGEKTVRLEMEHREAVEETGKNVGTVFEELCS